MHQRRSGNTTQECRAILSWGSMGSTVLQQPYRPLLSNAFHWPCEEHFCAAVTGVVIAMQMVE